MDCNGEGGVAVPASAYPGRSPRGPNTPGLSLGNAGDPAASCPCGADKGRQGEGRLICDLRAAAIPPPPLVGLTSTRCSAATSPRTLRVNSRFLCRKSWKSWSPESSISGAPCSARHGAHSSTPSSSTSPPAGTEAQHPPDTPGNPDPSARMRSATRPPWDGGSSMAWGRGRDPKRGEGDQCSLHRAAAGGSGCMGAAGATGRVSFWVLWVQCV